MLEYKLGDDMGMDRRLNRLFDEMLEDIKYSKIAAFTKVLYQDK